MFHFHEEQSADWLRLFTVVTSALWLVPTLYGTAHASSPRCTCPQRHRCATIALPMGTRSAPMRCGSCSLRSSQDTDVPGVNPRLSVKWSVGITCYALWQQRAARQPVAYAIRYSLFSCQRFQDRFGLGQSVCNNRAIITSSQEQSLICWKQRKYSLCS